MGNIYRSLQANPTQNKFFQKDYAVLTLSLIPYTSLPAGLHFACVGDGELFGEWQSEQANTLEYDKGTYSVKVIIPWAAREWLEFAFILQRENHQYVCSDTNSSGEPGSNQCANLSNRRKLASDGRSESQHDCFFKTPEGVELRCRVRIHTALVTAIDLARAVSRPKKAYFEQSRGVEDDTRRGHCSEDGQG
eukprot:CAMPEP_0198227300 /NCGR_PEP_ID=MMETSP1445-20131203/108686_1 /TAXON_ID=36898 /ORGANISM="Pyramimonas sp., Strain CCMP2087" /LENGTH=191 /DNA_ID=CAMNT_0043907321 /DNA_START=259 /DNA_END=831 /DNA_ORIENTATION=-